jgi:GntR family transcriptional regulator/MocR family aminotransferase
MSQALPSRERVTQKICETIQAQIASGLLGPGARLPSTRSLAAEWGVSRTTVTAAYDQLIAEGYLETRQGALARVAEGLGQVSAPAEPPTTRPSADRLSAFGQRLEGLSLPAIVGSSQLTVDFRYGDLAADDFPMLAWRKAVTGAVLRRKPRLRYEEPAGSSGLRIALQGYLWRGRGMRCEPEQIIVVNGSQQGLDLCARLLLDPGDRAVMENPGYNLARQVFVASGVDVFPAAVDQEGMRTEGLPPARLAYVTPSHQFPLGGVMSVGRRRELLAWARQEGSYVIEDDYDSEYRYDIAPIPTVQAMDDAGRVIYLGTVSKTLSPTLRLGYLVVPVALSGVFAQAKRLADRHAPSLEQEALADLIESGAYERHVRRVRRRNSERRAALLAALSVKLGDAVTVVGADAGLHMVVWLNDIPCVAEEEFASRAARAGLGIYPVGPLFSRTGHAARPDCAGLILGYAALPVGSIENGVEMLAVLIRSHQAG